MKTLKAAISLLLLSSVSALADETASTGSTSSLPMITAMTSGEKPAVDGVNGKLTVYGGAGEGNSINIVEYPDYRLRSLLRFGKALAVLSEQSLFHLDIHSALRWI